MPADVLVGRQLVVDALRSAADAAIAGAGGVVLLAGEAGMGKTALATEAAAYAKAHGALTVWGTCWEGDGAPGYWPWIQVVRALARDGGEGEAVLAELTGANEAADSVLGEEAAVRFRTYDMTAAYVRERAAVRPLVLVLDDLHWADMSSLRLLLFLARQLHDGSALVIGTYRDADLTLGEHPARALLAELAGQAGLLQLAGLTVADVGRLLTAVCGERPPDALAAEVHERTGGNPFFVQQTARLLAAQGAPLDRASVTGVPRAAGDVLARRLARLPRDVADLLSVAAVAGRHFAIAAVASIAGLAAEDAVPLVDVAAHPGVVEHDTPGGGRFSHDLFREVLYQELPAARRSALHLAVAELLEQDAETTAPAAQIAFHRAMALPLGDHGRALAAAAVDGARTAGNRRTLAYALFAQCDVRWEPGTAAERLRIAAELAVTAAAAGETELLLEAHLSRLVALLELGDPAFAAQLDAFSTLAEDAAIPRYLYMARSRRATLASLTGPLELASELIEAAAAYGERIGEPDAWPVQASQLAGLAFLRHDWARISALAAARGRSLTPPEFTLHEQAWRLVEAGEREAAATLVASLPDRPVVYRWRHAVLLTADAELAAVVGDRPRCAALYQRLQPLAGQFAVVAAAVFSTGPVALQLGLLAAALGRWEDAARHLEDAVARCDRLGARLHGDRARTELERVRAACGGASARDEPSAFRRDGEVWTLVFAGRHAQLRDAKGLRDLAVLLTAPGREVAAVDLVTGGAQPVPALGADPVLDERARAAYRVRLAELDDELAQADAHHDIGHSARLGAERDALIDELARATGLRGRRRRLGDTAERARSTVTARIRDAIGRIERAHPELGQHLRASVSTGTRCAYRPAETVSWQISQM
jgi:AAA ATPase domain